MKNTIFPFLLLSLLSCKTQNVAVRTVHLDIDAIPGRCYYSKQTEATDNTHEEPAFILEVIPPQYLDVEVTYSRDELDLPENNPEYLKLRYSNAYLKYVIGTEESYSWWQINPQNGFMVCLVEVPAEYKTFQKEELIVKEVTYHERKLVQHSRVIKKYVPNRPKELKENQYYFEAGYWTDLKEAIFPISCTTNTSWSIEKKLHELGYRIKVDGILDQATKDALRNFQIKNDLPNVGRLDLELLKKLGVEY